MTETMYETLMFAVLVWVNSRPPEGLHLTIRYKYGEPRRIFPLQYATIILACYWLWRVCT